MSTQQKAKQEHINLDFVPAHLREWFGRVGGKVEVRYTDEEGRELVISGRLVRVSPTGAHATISGVQWGDTSRRTLQFPLERCRLIPKGRTS
jgi:hypothetical protein